ncbi:MAG: T9SS type A sorting domain-containing protein, partial [Dyadobacter sp.]
WGSSAIGVTGELSSCNSVLSNAINSDRLIYGYNDTNGNVAVGRPEDNIVSVYRQSNVPLANSLDESTLLITGDKPIDIISLSGCRILARVSQKTAKTINNTIKVKAWVEETTPMYQNKPFVARHYEINSAGQFSSYAIKATLYFAQREFDTFNSHPGSILNLPSKPDDIQGKARLKISFFYTEGDSGSGLPEPLTAREVIINPDDEKIIYNDVMKRWEVTFDMPGFGYFFVHTNEPALPVTLIEFKGALKEDQTILSWQTTNEINTSRFEVERSLDARNFLLISSVPAQNFNGIHTYSSSDSSVSHLGVKNIFYRLKMIDQDERFAYSRIVNVLIEPKNFLIVYPSPASSTVTIKFTIPGNETIKVKLISTKGEAISNHEFQMTKGVNSIDVDINHLSNGSYLLDVKGETFVERKLFIKL